MDIAGDGSSIMAGGIQFNIILFFIISIGLMC